VSWRTFLALLSLTAVPTNAFAGAWTLEAGQGDAIVNVTPSTAPEAFIGSKSLSPTYDKIEVEGFVEYGITNSLTAIFAPNFDDIQIGAPTNAGRIGLGYTEFGGRYALLQGSDWIVSAQTTLRVPGTFDNSNPAAIGYTSFENDVRGLFGKSFSIGSMAAFVDVQTAQRFIFTGPPNEFHEDATLGVRFLPRWLVLLQSFTVISEGDRLPVFPSYNYSKVEVSLVYDLTKQWSLQGGGFTTYEEHNALQEHGLIFGAWYRF
jgi:hypothetical protein